MEESHTESIANSIFKHLPTTIKNEAYVESIGKSSRLFRKDGEGQFPLLGVLGDNTLILYDKSKQDELHCAISTGLERTGYKIKFDPINLGSSILYLIEKTKV